MSKAPSSKINNMSELKATCKSPANIAFIKYWGKTDPKTRVPQNNSISMCLSGLFSICTVEFRRGYYLDKIMFLDEKVVKKKERERIIAVLDRVRKLKKTKLKARVVTKNNFPKAVGIASSASGLSSVTFAACQALGLNLTKVELSKLCRLASGTACRSVPDGFVEWKKGTNTNDSYSVQIFPPDYWDIVDVVVIVSSEMKKISSTEGHALANTSPFQKSRLLGMPAQIKAIKKAMKEKNFTAFGQIIEQESLNMHAICLTSQPSILYWNPSTIRIMKDVQAWRQAYPDSRLESYFTIDAGSSVHIICQKKDKRRLVTRLKRTVGVEKIVVNQPSVGARIIDEHLF